MSSVSLEACDRQQSLDDEGSEQDRVRVSFEIPAKELIAMIRTTRKESRAPTSDSPYKDFTTELMRQIYEHMAGD